MFSIMFRKGVGVVYTLTEDTGKPGWCTVVRYEFQVEVGRAVLPIMSAIVTVLTEGATYVGHTF